MKTSPLVLLLVNLVVISSCIDSSDVKSPNLIGNWKSISGEYYNKIDTGVNANLMDTSWYCYTFTFFENKVMAVYVFSRMGGDIIYYYTYTIKDDKVIYSSDSAIWSDGVKEYWSDSIKAYVGDSIYVKTTLTDTLKFKMISVDTMRVETKGLDSDGEFILDKRSNKPSIPIGLFPKR